MQNERANSFPPIVTAQSRVLILGSMPGVPSLKAREYYANPRNAFWPIMEKLFGLPVDTYANRVRLIEQSGLALWDVLESCERKGSLDSAIRDSRVNDFDTFLKKHPHITHIFFNGAQAEKDFKREMKDVFENSGLIFARLPSTSPTPTNPPLSFDDKVGKWSVVKTVLQDAPQRKSIRRPRFPSAT